MRHIISQIQKTYGMAEPEERQAVLNNFAFLSALQVITYVMPILMLPYLFRVIGPDKFGLLAFAQAFIQYFMILTDYGFNVSATREISVHHQDPHAAHRVFYAVMTIKVILVIVSALLLMTAIHFVPKFELDWKVYVYSFGVVIGNALFPHWFFQGIEKMKPIADLNIFGGALSAGLIFVLIKSPQDYLLVPLIQSAVSITTGLWGQYLVLRIVKVPVRLPTFSEIKKELMSGFYVFLSIVAINAYTTTRIFAVGFFLNNTITGFYAAGEKIAGLFQTFPLVPFSQALFPRLSKIYQKNKERALEFMEKIQRITINVSLICLPLGFIFAPFIVRVLCGRPYEETILSFRILLLGVLFVGSNAFRVQFLLICGRARLYSKIHILAALIGVPLILVGIGYYSYAGVAAATALIEMGIFTATFISSRKLSLVKKSD